MILAAAASVAGTGRGGDGGMDPCAFWQILQHRAHARGGSCLWSWLAAAWAIA